MPVALPLLDGRVFSALDSINPFWALFTSNKEPDQRGLVNVIRSALDVSAGYIGGSSINDKTLAARLERYLVQHPYTQTFQLNVFNPGDIAVLSGALEYLQKQSAFSQLNYDIRLFVSDPQTSKIGDSFEELLLRPTGVSSEAKEAFSIPSGNHLYPKLSFAIHAINDFAQSPREYQAHLSILFNLFPSEEIGAEKPIQKVRYSPVHGLVQEYATVFRDNSFRNILEKTARFMVQQFQYLNMNN